jgi:prepilin-type N-terminal cleavage/methylation domain-containing protein
MKLSSLKQSKGFTLVEILIVVIIVGLLAGIAVSKLGDSKERAVAAVKKSAAAELNKAIQTAYVKGQIIATIPAGIDLAAVSDLTEVSQIANQFTASSLQELRLNIVDTTPNSGTLGLSGNANHNTLEVTYTP